LRFVCSGSPSGVPAVQMLTGPTPTLTNWITYRPGVERSLYAGDSIGGGVHGAEHVAAGSITVSLYGTLASTPRRPRTPARSRETLVLEERLAAGQGVGAGGGRARTADAWVLEVLFVTQILST